MFSQGKIKENEIYTQKSIIDTSFTSKIIKTSNNGKIIPQITGSAFITGFNNLYVDPNDKIKNGFFLN